MILGIGTDIIEIDRIEQGMNRNKRFLQRIFTQREIEFFKSKNYKYESIAGSFAAKEAVSKSLGTGIRGIAFTDIEILRDELGKPYVEVSERIKNSISSKSFRFNVSISHNKTSAIAFAIMEE